MVWLLISANPRLSVAEKNDGERGSMINLKHGQLTQAIIGAAFEVHRVLGHGFLEKVYQRAMQVELQQQGLQVDAEFPIRVTYKGSDVGDYAADLFVERKVLVELKVAKEYNPKDEPQILNELKATGVEVGLLINFGADKVEFKRLVFTDLSAFRPHPDPPERDEEAGSSG
jgi:GxxExxY protein